MALVLAGCKLSNGGMLINCWVGTTIDGTPNVAIYDDSLFNYRFALNHRDYNDYNASNEDVVL